MHYQKTFTTRNVKIGSADRRNMIPDRSLDKPKELTLTMVNIKYIFSYFNLLKK